MDITLLKTFLAVSETGSFAAASDRLHVTQSAVSLRVQRLEELLGHELFVRSKTGTEPTPSGREFTSYALTLLRTWEQACQKIAAPDGQQSLVLGGQFSLWPRLGFRWLGRLMAERPDLAIRAELGETDSLAHSMETGGMHVCLTYQPVARPGLRVEKVLEDELVLVAPWPNPRPDQLAGRYALIDWGPEFQKFHDATLPGLNDAALTLDMGAASAPFLISSNLAAFLPARVAKPLIDSGALSVVENSQSFRHIAFSVWREDLDEQLAAVARKTLFAAVDQAILDTNEVADQAVGTDHKHLIYLGKRPVDATSLHR